MPSANMVIGETCADGIKVATVLFTAKDIFDTERVDTDLSFASLLIAPAGKVRAWTTAPVKPVTITLNK